MGNSASVDVKIPSPTLQFSANVNDDKGLIYVLDEKKEKMILGAGSFKKVYKGKYAGVPVAIAEIPGDGDAKADLKALEGEINIMSYLRHPSIVALYGYVPGTATSDPAIIMEEMGGGALDSALHKKKTLSVAPNDRLKLMRQIAGAIAYLHDAGITCRDIKPANILLSGDMKMAKLSDFGTAKRRAFGDAKAMSSYVGTPYYMAPEVMRKENYTDRVDVYSCSLVFYELITGVRPFNFKLPAEIAKGILKEGTRPALNAAIPAPLAALLVQLWAEDATLRPSMHEVVSSLDKLIKK